MPPRPCVVCQHGASKYACASCRVDYCSVACYKRHKETCSPGSTDTPSASVPFVQGNVPPAAHTTYSPAPPEPEPGPASSTNPDSAHPPGPQPLQDPAPLRPLTALKWPYVPDTTAYPDPLTRDDPKPLQLHQYEAIATSPTVRTLLVSSRLCTLLTSIDALRGPEREEALQRALGVDSRLLKNDDASTRTAVALDEDTRAFRTFAVAVEEAVRGAREDVLGLDWD